MNTFRLEIQSPVSDTESFTDVVSFTGRDSSGSFGILAHAERRLTALKFGLASFRCLDGRQEYLAVPGGLLYFVNNELFITTRKYVRSPDFEKITKALENEIKAAESLSLDTRRSLRKLDQEILKRLSHLNWRDDL